jgi:hypothetical protein
VITPECGVKIPVTTPETVIQNLATVLAELARDPSQRQRLSEGARRRAGDYLWTLQGERMAEVYRRVLNQAGSDAEPHDSTGLGLGSGNVDGESVGDTRASSFAQVEASAGMVH